MFKDKIIKEFKKKCFKNESIKISLFFTVYSDSLKEIENISKNIRMFENNENIEIIILDLSGNIETKKNYVKILFLNKKIISYFSLKNFYSNLDVQKSISLLSKNEITAIIGSGVILNTNFLEFLNSNLYDNKSFLWNEKSRNLEIYISSRDFLYRKCYCDINNFENKKIIIPLDLFEENGDLIDGLFKNSESSEDIFCVFDINDKDVDLYYNKIIKSLWIGKDLSDVEKLSIKSFIANGHEYHLYLYDDIKGIPDGVIIKDANDILDGKKVFFQEKNDRKLKLTYYSDIANWFRCLLLYRYGGWWVDLDVICLKNFNIKKPYVFSKAWKTKGRLNNAILKFPFHSSILKDYSEESILDNVEGTLHKDDKFLDNLTEEVNIFFLKDFAFDSDFFEPLKPSETYKFFAEKIKIDDSISFSVHLFNSFLAINNIDKNGSFPYESSIEHYKRKYL